MAGLSCGVGDAAQQRHVQTLHSEWQEQTRCQRGPGADHALGAGRAQVRQAQVDRCASGLEQQLAAGLEAQARQPILRVFALGLQAEIVDRIEQLTERSGGDHQVRQRDHPKPTGALPQRSARIAAAHTRNPELHLGHGVGPAENAVDMARGVGSRLQWQDAAVHASGGTIHRQWRAFLEGLPADSEATQIRLDLHGFATDDAGNVERTRHDGRVAQRPAARCHDGL